MLRSREAESRAEGESYAAYDSLPQYRRSGVHTPTASAKVARTDEVVALSNLDDDACVGTVSRRTRRVSSPFALQTLKCKQVAPRTKNAIDGGASSFLGASELERIRARRERWGVRRKRGGIARRVTKDPPSV